jgi:bifunctional DNA-binding transcriptional regulator/antitoxin component of YhaV-PrlF toxin-antitoxin module
MRKPLGGTRAEQEIWRGSRLGQESIVAVIETAFPHTW